MANKKTRLYHLFLAFAILHLLVYYLLIGKSTLDINNNDNVFFDDKMFNYFLSVSLLMLVIWLIYWVFRNRLISTGLIWVHLCITFITVFILPRLALWFFPMPRRYFDYDDSPRLSDFFGSMTGSFLLVGFILLASEVLLIKNIRHQHGRSNFS